MRRVVMGWLPTKKWWAATITGVGGLLVTLAATGWDFTPEMQGALITIGVQRIAAWLYPNDPTPGGVPGRRRSGIA
jgi:hypothetical protein